MVVEHFLGIMPEHCPQGHGSPLVETMEQATVFALQEKLRGPMKLELVQPDNPQGSSSRISNTESVGVSA
eukprot:8134366-Karenia_brevis.AAC.2